MYPSCMYPVPLHAPLQYPLPVSLPEYPVYEWQPTACECVHVACVNQCIQCIFSATSIEVPLLIKHLAKLGVSVVNGFVAYTPTLPITQYPPLPPPPAPLPTV